MNQTTSFTEQQIEGQIGKLRDSLVEGTRLAIQNRDITHFVHVSLWEDNPFNPELDIVDNGDKLFDYINDLEIELARARLQLDAARQVFAIMTSIYT
jgi:hypothetical protein